MAIIERAEMELPSPNKVRYDFAKTIENFDSFITFISTEESLQYTEFLKPLHTIKMELIEAWHRINLLTITDKKYGKAFEKMRKILIKLLVNYHDIERKYVKKNFLLWKHKFKEGRLRKDTINFFKNVSKQLKKVQKTI